jgi:glucosamine--fructose-6-phosphate aminotransferase (isomerizing)
MCGIVGYVGKREALPILVRGLSRLEYRGYDSAGVAVLNEGVITKIRSVGKISNLSEKIKGNSIPGTLGIAHTRWATHGGVTEANAHPHSDCTGEITIAHNGIIENYRELKKELNHHTFVSETDTEVLVHLIEENYHGDLRAALQAALKRVRGTYGVVVMHTAEPGKIVAARLGSPLAVGIGENEYFIASDTSPMLAYTQQVVFLDDGEVAEITEKGLKLFNLLNESLQKSSKHIDWNESEAQLSGWPHFMLKEIFDQPAVLQDALRGRLLPEEGAAHLGGLNMSEEEMSRIERVILLGCGTASHAAMVGKIAFERLSGIPTSVEIASEFRYSDPIIGPETLVFAISQSGETADTLAAVREAKRKGAVTRGIVNVVGSTIARECNGGTYIHAGPELAVASTKAFTNMSAVLIMYALQFGRQRRLSVATGERLVRALLEIPEKMKKILDKSEDIKLMADKFSKYQDFYFLGRGIGYPVAMEGSLKLKEITYIHSEAYPGGEMKHGPIALLSDKFPVFAVLTKNQLYDKMISNIEETKARKAPILIIATEGDEEIKKLSDNIIFIPPTMEILEPLLSTIPFQLFAYHMAVLLGRDVDRPRNLAKSVTVE